MLLVLIPLAACAQTAVTPSPTVSPTPQPITRIVGSVRTTEGLPVAGVVVCLTACSDAPARTDERGEFALEVPRGPFTWTVVYYREIDGARIEMDRRVVTDADGDTYTLAPLVIRGR